MLKSLSISSGISVKILKTQKIKDYSEQNKENQI